MDAWLAARDSLLDDGLEFLLFPGVLCAGIVIGWLMTALADKGGDK